MIRLVRVILDNGEIEVLATNVSSAVIPAKAFKKLYHLRWGIETFFLILKDRLNLENFTGTSLIAVLQDVWATLFLSNLESLLTVRSRVVEVWISFKQNRFFKKFLHQEFERCFKV